MSLVIDSRPSAIWVSRQKFSLGIILFLCALIIFFGFGENSTANAQSGCCTVRGNCDCSPDGIVDISDLTRLIDNLFISLDPLCCVDAANTDASPDGIVDISDLTVLIDHLFISLNPMVVCDTGEMPFTVREAVFNGIDSVYDELDGLSLDTIAARLVAYLRTLPAIDSAEVIDSVSVTAWFTDGRIISIPNNRLPTGSNAQSSDWPEFLLETSLPTGFKLPGRRFPDVTDPLPGNVDNSMAAPHNAFNYELPTSIQARVTSTLGTPCFTIGAPTVKSLLENNGYVVVPFTATVSSLLNVNDDGVFYIDAHGGSCLGKDNVKHLAVWTATVFQYNLDTAFRTLLNRNELVYMYARDKDPFGVCSAHWRFAFTGKFVAQYMHFAPHSFVFINACQTDSVSTLRQGFLTAGASVFCGWSKIIHDPAANKAAEFLFDRMLGANASTLTPKESPPQRPFDVDLLWQDMKSRGFDTDPLAPKAKLGVRRLQGNFGLLAPSIRNLEVVEHFDTLYVLGMFGTDPGPSKRRVIMGGTDMLVYDWQPWLITCFIPNTGAGSVGPVTVEVDGTTGPSSSIKRVSNVVNFTEWRGKFTYTMQDTDSLLGKIEIDLHLRGDIHRFRDYPHGPTMFYSQIIPAAEDSYGLASIQGSYSYTWPDTDPVSIDTWTWAGSHYLPGLWEQDLSFFSTFQVFDVSKTLHLQLVAAEGRGMTETLVNNNNGWQYTEAQSVQIPNELYDMFYGKFNLTLTNTWNIVGGQRSTYLCCSHNPANENGTPDVLHKISWPTITASFAPDSTAAQ